MAYALSDGSAEVLVPIADWEFLGAQFDVKAGRARRISNLIAITLPFGMIFFALFPASFLPHPLVFAGILLGLGVWFASPLIWYPLQIRKITQEVETRLKTYPKTRPSKRDPRRQPRVLQILFLLLVGPHLLVSAYGGVAGPDAFLNTLWVGRDFGTLEWIGLVILVLWFLWPRIAKGR